MLILKRKVDQEIFVTMASGELVTIMLVESKEGWARIGITAPASAEIMRDDALLTTKKPSLAERVKKHGAA